MAAVLLRWVVASWFDGLGLAAPVSSDSVASNEAFRRADPTVTPISAHLRAPKLSKTVLGTLWLSLHVCNCLTGETMLQLTTGMLKWHIGHRLYGRNA
jgi:hypothetical protein